MIMIAYVKTAIIHSKIRQRIIKTDDVNLARFHVVSIWPAMIVYSLSSPYHWATLFLILDTINVATIFKVILTDYAM